MLLFSAVTVRGIAATVVSDGVYIQGGAGEDWRAFRARLIQTGISTQQNQSEAVANGSDDPPNGTRARKIRARSLA